MKTCGFCGSYDLIEPLDENDTYLCQTCKATSIHETEEIDKTIYLIRNRWKKRRVPHKEFDPTPVDPNTLTMTKLKQSYRPVKKKRRR